jgi:hypothetical protein
MTEMARKVMAHAMDIHAGQMIQVGPRNFLAHPHIAIPISITVEGANILTRNLIIFGQGAVRCHPYLLQELKLFSADIPLTDKIQQWDTLLLSHLGYGISNLARSIVSGLTGGRFIKSPVQGSIAHYYRQLTRMSMALALLSDSCMLLLGGHLKRKERLSARLGDILSELYLGSAVLKYFNDQGSHQTELDYVKWSVETCLYHIQTACDELLANFPLPWLGKLCRWLIFPYGTAYRRPADLLYHNIVSPMITLSHIRERLTRHCYLDSTPNSPMQKLERALANVDTIDPIWKKFQKALKKGTLPHQAPWEKQLAVARTNHILTEEEADNLQDFYKLYQEIIAVDEFSFDLKNRI